MSSSPSALCGYRRGTFARRPPLDLLPAPILLARAGAGAPVSPAVPEVSGESLRHRQTEVLLLPGVAPRPGGFLRHLAPARKLEWNVYAKAPFAGPQQVLDYVGRYTHRVALSNNRLLDIEEGQVRFRWKDYRDDNQQKTMTLTAEEFIRRFLIHVLPAGFQRIRYYGLLGSRYREQKLARC